jgi:hypothetical protein
MGADAFFGPPVDQQVDEEVHQDTGIEIKRQVSLPVEQDSGVEVEKLTSIPVNLSNAIEAHQDASLPDYQWDGVGVESDTDVEVYHQDTKTPKRLTGKAGKKSNSKPVYQPTDTETIKASYYVTIEDDLKLENIRLARRKRGIKTDKSALVREAIAKLKE